MKPDLCIYRDLHIAKKPDNASSTYKANLHSKSVGSYINRAFLNYSFVNFFNAIQNILCKTVFIW